MKKTFDYNKEQCRGTLKQIMKVRGLRTISIANYINWLNNNSSDGIKYDKSDVHSLKIDLQDGYINAYGWNGNKCGSKIEDLSADEYRVVLSTVNSILLDESRIPYRIKRNIFVKMCR